MRTAQVEETEEMIVAQTNELELLESWQDEDPAARVRFLFPLVGVPEAESLGVVCFEVQPGDALAMHTDSLDEIVIVMSGSGEGTIGDESGWLSAGALVFIPAMAPHGFRNTGTETLRCIGIFAGSDLVSTFEHPLQPFGIRVFEAYATPAA
jgi:mannose-6-phosphate isomerase-like protein (cupin superfamily)